MAQKVVIGVEFLDSGGSAQKIADSLSKAVKKSKLSDSVKTQTQEVVAQLQSYAENVKKIKPGQPVDRKLFSEIFKQSKQAQKGVTSLIKAINQEIKKMTLSKEVSSQVDEVETKLDEATKLRKENSKKIEKLQWRENPVGVTGFANTKNIDKLETRIEEFWDKYKKAKDASLDPTDTKAQSEFAQFEKDAVKIKALTTEIQKRREEITKLNESNAVQDANIIKFTQDLVKLTASAEGNPIFDPKVLRQLLIDNKLLDEQLEKVALEQRDFNRAAEEGKTPLSEFSQNIQNSVKNLFGYAAIFGMIKRVIRESIRVIGELDKSFTEIAMVTSYSTKEVWAMKDAMVGLSETTGLAISEVAKLSVEFFRQGRSLSETMKLVEAAGIAAKLAGISSADSVNYLTSAINGYRLSADQAMVVSDKFAALAAASATDYEELAIALTKVGAQAYSAGVNMDNMMGFIAQALETTREAPENIGTAFKTIFARMSEIKDYGKTLEDGMDVNRVDKALSTIGVALTNQENELRNLDDVLIDVGNKWDTLDKNQKAYITTALAGTRQQTRLLAVFEDFDRTMELSKISADSLGASYAQQAKYLNSIEYATTMLQTAWQDFITNLVDSDIVIFFTNLLTEAVKLLDLMVNNPVGQFTLLMIGLTYAVKALNAALATESITKLISNLKNADGPIRVLIPRLYALATGQKFVASATATSTLAIQEQTIALLTNPYVLAAAAIIALAGAIGFMAYKAYKANGTIENLEKTTRKYNASIYDINKRANDIQNLTEKYKELAKQTNITAEEEKQLSEYAQQIQDLAGEDYNVVDFNGELNLDAVQKTVDDLTSKTDQEFENMVNNIEKGLNRLSYDFESLDFGSKTAYNMSKAMELYGAKTRKEFQSLDKNVQDYYTALANAANEATYASREIQVDQSNYYDSSGYTDIPTTTVVIIPELSETEIEELNKKLGQSVFDTWSGSNAIDKAAQLVKLGYDSMGIAEKEYVNNVLAGAKTISTINDLYGDGANAILEAMGTNLDAYDELVAKFEDMEIFDETQRRDIIGNVLVKGAAKAFDDLLLMSDELKLNFEDILSMATTFNELEFENINTIKALGGLQGMIDSLDKVQSMLAGEEEFDLSTLKEMVNIYPEIAQYIMDNGQLSEDEIKKAMEQENARAENQLQNENIYYENQIAILQAEYDAYEELSKDKAYLEQMSVETAMALQGAGLQVMLTDHAAYLDSKAKLDGKYAEMTAKITKGIADGTYKSYQEAYNALAGQYQLNAPDLKLKSSIGLDGTILDSASKVIAERMNQIQGQIDKYRALIKINESAISKIGSGTLFKNANESAKEYEAKLNEIYILEQQLAALQNKMEEYTFMEENAETGDEWLIAIHSQNAALEAQNEVMQDLVDTHKSTQNSLYNNLGSLKSAVKIIDGRMVPVMENYNKLSGKQQELIDQTVDSYNDSSDAIHENSQSIRENTVEIEKNLQKIEDKTVEFYDILKAAIIAEEDEKLQILKDGLEEERKLLDKRREMYEDAFSETDYLDALKETTDKRAKVIEELAALEGATDLNSQKRRQELLKEKAELDKEYNSTTVDYNKDALFETIDKQQQIIDETEAKYQAAYEERVNSVAWMEARIQEIIQSGDEATIQYLKDNLPEYQDAWTITRDNIEDEWRFLYDVVDGTIDNIETSIPDFTNLLTQLREAARLAGEIRTGNNGGGGSGDSGGTVDDTPKTGNSGISYSTVWGSWSLFKETSIAKIYRQYEMKLTKKDGVTINGRPTGNYREKTEPKPTPKTPINQMTTGSQISPANVKNTSFGGVQSKVLGLKTGGLVSDTGLALLHGTSGKPERVLDPVQTSLFDRMVEILGKISNPTMTTMPVGPISSANASVSIGNVQIAVNGLQTDDDFTKVGDAFGNQLKAAIKERGLNINKKR